MAGGNDYTRFSIFIYGKIFSHHHNMLWAFSFLTEARILKPPNRYFQTSFSSEQKLSHIRACVNNFFLI